MDTVKDVIVIGAGISGLVAATTLQKQMYDVAVLEQSPIVGGRMATAKLQDGIADYGAQFFTARTPIFQKQVDNWIQSGLVFVWGHDWSDGSIKDTNPDGGSRYAAHSGMYTLAQAISKEVEDIHFQVSVKAVEWLDNHWVVTDKNGATYTGSVLILTPPVPISLKLLVNISLSNSEYEELNRITYNPALCGLFAVTGDVNLPTSGGVQDFSNSIYWIADNLTKGISPQQRVITMQLNRLYSQKYFDDPDEVTLQFLQDKLEKHLQPGATITAKALKKWQYGLPLTTYPYDILQVENAPLIFAGDGFGGRGRFEGAYLSGLAAGRAANSIIQNKQAAYKFINQS